MTTREITGDPDRILKSFAALVTLTGIYPAGHPLVAEKLREVDEAVQQQLKSADAARIDVIRGVVHLNGIVCEGRGDTYGLPVDSLHFETGVTTAEIATVASFLSRTKLVPGGEPVQQQLSRAGVHHISLGRLVPLDTRWRTRQWPDRPEHALDPDYEESLSLAQQAFDRLSDDRTLDIRAVGDLVRLLMFRVVASNAALPWGISIRMAGWIWW